MRKLQLEDFLKYHFLSNVKVSPQGDKIAYTLVNANLSKNAYKPSIYVYYKAQGHSKKIIDLNDMSDFVWFDNNSIVLKANVSKSEKKRKASGLAYSNFYKLELPDSLNEETIKKKGALLSNLNTSKSKADFQKMFELPLGASNFRFIDSDHLIFTASFDLNAVDLTKTIGLEPSKAEPIIASAITQINENKPYEVLDEIPFWLNNSGFTNGIRNRLYLYHISTKTLECLIDGKERIESYQLNSDKTKILYLSSTFEDKSEHYNSLYQYDIKSKNAELLFSEPNMDFYGAYYIGDKILCAAADMNKIGVNTDIDFYVLDVNAKGEGLKNIAPDYQYGMGVSVGNDCRYGIYNSTIAHCEKLYFTSTQGYDGKLSAIDNMGKITDISTEIGSIDCFDVFDDEIYCIAFRNNELPELYRLDDNSETKLTNHNSHFIKTHSIQAIEHFTINSSNNEIDGFVILPSDFDENKSYPMILNIHGGPKTVFGDIYHHEMQYFANEGYVVAYCNPRGSDGKGDSFSDIRGKYGTIDYDDILCFTNEVLKRYPAIDKKRLGVMGGSYGGFMTNWIITQTDLFAAAISQRSISNLISKFGITDIGYYFVPDQQGADPWQDVDKLWWHSPLKYAQNAKTPTLFIHSDEDYRCDIGQGLQMFTALKYFGIPSKLVMFKGENHELSRSGKPKARIRRLQEMSAWFEKYLK